MKKDLRNGAQVANVSKAEIEASKVNVKNVQQAIDRTVEILRNLDKTMARRYEASDRREEQLNEAQEHFMAAINNLGTLLGYEAITMALDSVTAGE